MNEPGVYGKLPAHGDFIQRSLPPAFVREWDLWCQSFIAGTKEQIGADWLEVYLTSPIWRFALSSGVVDEGRWAGVLLPSVDQVGRYFPFTIAVRLPDRQNPLEFMSSHVAWYRAIEELGLRALDGEIALDDLVQELAGVELDPQSAYAATDALRESTAMHVDMEFEEQSAASVYPSMLDAVLIKLLSSYSVWSTTGSERVAPCVFNVQGLPGVNRLPAMLDGQWRQRGWTQPYALQPVVGTVDTDSVDASRMEK
jgi:type VI secretion system protein ImpM